MFCLFNAVNTFLKNLIRPEKDTRSIKMHPENKYLASTLYPCSIDIWNISRIKDHCLCYILKVRHELHTPSPCKFNLLLSEPQEFKQMYLFDLKLSFILHPAASTAVFSFLGITLKILHKQCEFREIAHIFSIQVINSNWFIKTVHGNIKCLLKV